LAFEGANVGEDDDEEALFERWGDDDILSLLSFLWSGAALVNKSGDFMAAYVKER